MAIIATVLLLPACSNSNLTSSPQVDQTTLANDLTTMSTGGGTLLSSGAFDELLQSSMTETFFAESDNVRTPGSLFAIDDMGLVDQQWSGYSSDDIGFQDAQVAFLDGFLTDGSQSDPRSFVLMVQLTDSQGNVTYFAAQSSDGSYAFTKTDFTVSMTASSASGTQNITLYSTNVDPQDEGELGNTVTFQVYDQSDNYLGQITALHLYQ